VSRDRPPFKVRCEWSWRRWRRPKVAASGCCQASTPYRACVVYTCVKLDVCKVFLVSYLAPGVIGEDDTLAQHGWVSRPPTFNVRREWSWQRWRQVCSIGLLPS